MVISMELCKTIKEKSGISITKLAKSWNVSRQSIYDALNGKGSRRLRVEIANIVGQKPSCVYEYTDRKAAILDDYEFDQRYGVTK